GPGAYDFSLPTGATYLLHQHPAQASLEVGGTQRNNNNGAFPSPQQGYGFWVAYSDHSKFEKVNDLHVANACWFIFVTMTTIGYGDIAPSTHVGRFVAVIAAQVGIILVSLITAALANLMKYDTSEQSAMVIIGRE
ncbi:hypothetical protein T484DRAFT_1813629, partial [Baffinella frigidus]